MRSGGARRQFEGALLVVAVVLASVFGAAAPVCAHTLSESLSSWRIDGDTVRLQFTVPDLEAKRVTPSGKDQPSSAQLGRYLAEIPDAQVEALASATDALAQLVALLQHPPAR